MLEIDVRTELERYDWRRATWGADKLIACSPFREDSTPSFYVWLDGENAGYWGDSGTGERGGFTALLARLRGESEAETAEYLRVEYGLDTAVITDKPPKLARLQRVLAPPKNTASLAVPAVEPSAYLAERGIPAEIQALYGAGQAGDTVVLPWLDARGRVRALKYRLTDRKAFWYAKGGVPVRELIYGLDVVYRQRAAVAVITEAEIDAMSAAMAVAGESYIGIATGGSKFSREKAELLMRSPLERLIVASDNDEAGRLLAADIKRWLGGHMRVDCVEWGGSLRKDINEVLAKDGAFALGEMFGNIGRKN
ncbi:toprim domain-containing protein [Alkalihalobacillus pseudalcaliphilus]|uniref:toprim domain-containing protein n=1 Tax=Alkalihalobacillus pseudalcaliphilus TaxID=79884 RepID=UPI00064D98FF|nr:toprim domain-containing protein [Alkalihalobacillus pseudalcaliphilus]KMK75413.1 hypothetical protein AB990_08835 [Alkalihalobacillus pseudalcaliphilus]